MSLLDTGYDKFDAIEKHHNDGAESCSVTLTVTDSEDDVENFDGETGKEHGHAEMDALYQFLNGIGWDVEQFKTYSLTLTCQDKACCKHCSAILGHLGVTAGEKTYKSNRTMGKTSYSIHPSFRSFLAKYLKCKEEKIRVELLGWTT